MKYPVTTICGSMKYYEKMLIVAKSLTKRGHIVLMPFVKKNLMGDNDEESEMLDDMHNRKIDMSEAIAVVAEAHYIGSSTEREIEYAKANGKAVRYYLH